MFVGERVYTKDSGRDKLILLILPHKRIMVLIMVHIMLNIIVSFRKNIIIYCFMSYLT